MATTAQPTGTAAWDTVNGLVPRLHDKRIRSLVVRVHEGGFSGSNINGCGGLSAPIMDIVARLNRAVDRVATGHTHQPATACCQA